MLTPDIVRVRDLDVSIDLFMLAARDCVARRIPERTAVKAFAEAMERAAAEWILANLVSEEALRRAAGKGSPLDEKAQEGYEA